MASNLNSADATKKNKSSSNESSFNNKNFNHQKNQKSRNQNQTKGFTNEKSAMETNGNNTTNSKGTNESGDKNAKNSQSQEKNNSPNSDEDRCWKFRPPPRGFTSETYLLCQNFHENGICNFGLNCVHAHSSGELQEWKDRFDFRKTQHENSLKLQYGKSYTEELLERLHQSTNPEKIMKEKLERVEVTCSNELNLTVSSKTCKREWIFVLKTTKLLKAVALLQDEHRTHFAIKHVFPMHPGKQTSLNQIDNNKNLTIDQEWTLLANIDSTKSTTKELDTDNETVVSHRVKIGFSTDIYGTFRQAVCFEFFGIDTILVKHFCIDVVPLEEYDKIQEIKNDILSVTRTRWSSSNSNFVPYKTPAQTYSSHQFSMQAFDTEKETELLERYPCPQADTFVLSHSTINGRLSENNYQQWMHTLLYIEEMARFDLIAKFNLTTNLKITNNFILAPNGMATSTAKYSHSGELFGVLELSQNISEETPPGYLILNNCNSLFFTKNVNSLSTKTDLKPDVYEALIEDKSKNIIYLKLSAETVKTLGFKHEDTVKVDIQFQPNRLTYCEWHLAIDKISDYKILFPETNIDPDIPWNPKRQWDTSLDQKLNSKQKEAVVTITSPITKPLPPILLIGPYGTGKTYTLAQIIKQLLTQNEARILICTHSNSAADLYIREYLHPWVEGGLEDAKPLRIYYHKRWVATVHSVVQKYCLIEMKGNARVFKRPTVEDVYKHKIVVVTLSTSMELASLNLRKGYFTHILLDEAAQALECEAITPLALADINTRIVLAGDHMQMSPEIFSNFARERKLHISLLERLYEYYPTNFPTKILLCENYRAHEAIIKFTSELFYDQKLIASGKQPRHEKFYPLTFFTSRGEDVQDKNSTAFYNNSEVYEIVDRVCELRRKWPPAWGKFNDQSIGIMTPYADQVFRIRSELRKKRLAGISVERVLNVQGKQFRAVFLSTVRTRKTCSNKSEDIDYGFLSNSKLLNTAITRAQSLVSVVGDPVALCSVGRCRKVWERFIEICHQNKSLFGITWQMLKSQLDGVELRKTYVLNPLAPEFIPRALQTESYLREQMIVMNPRKFGNMLPPIPQPAVQPHPMNYHHAQQQQSQLTHPPPYLPHMSTQQPHNNMMMNPFPQHAGPSQAPQYNSSMMNQSIRPFGSPSYPMQPPPPPPPSTSQQFSPYNNNPFPSFNQNYNQPAAMAPPQAPAHQPHSMMQNYHMNPHMNVAAAAAATNMWNSSAASPLFQGGGGGGLDKASNQGPWMKPPPPPMLSQQSPHQIRPPIGPPPQMRPVQPTVQQHQQMFTPPPQYHSSLPQQQQQQQPQASSQPMQMNMSMGLNSYPGNIQKFPQSMNDMSAYNGNHGNLDFNLLTNTTSKLTLNELISQPDLLENLKKNEKEVQFLHNVHFPEKNMSMNAAMHQQLVKTLSNSSYSNYSHLLPQNMTFYDIATKSKEFQYSWFLKLSEQYGLEEADKFVELLRQVPLMTNATNSNLINNNNHHNNNNMINNMGKPMNNIELETLLNGVDEPAKNYMHLMDMQSSKVDSNNLLKIPITSSYNDNSKMFHSEDIDSIFMNSLQNQQQHQHQQKPSYESLMGAMSSKEIEMKQNSALLGSLFQQPTPSTSNNFTERNILNGIDIFNLPSKSIDLEMDSSAPSPQRSVPLYMRASKNTK